MGGWEQAAQFPIADTLELVTTHLRGETLKALQHAQLCWYSALPLYSNGGKPPDPPKDPDPED